MHAFVTGSTGLLGSNLVQLLLERGHRVTALVRSVPRGRGILGDLSAAPDVLAEGPPARAQRPEAPLRLVQGDVRDVAAYAPALEGVDAVFHGAAYFREYFGPGDHAPALQATNVQATLDLIAAAAAHGVGRFVFVGSSGTVGRHSGNDTSGRPAPSDETVPPGPVQLRNGYFRSKWEAEQAIAIRVAGRDLPVVTVLPGWMFGPRDSAPTTSGRLVLDLLQRRLPVTFAGGASVADSRDVAAALLAAAERGRPGERYIAGGRVATLEEIANGVAAASGVPAPRLRLPVPLMLGVATLAETWSRLRGTSTLLTVEGIRTLSDPQALDSGKAARELGVTFRPLAETLRDEVQWFRHSPVSPLPPAVHHPRRRQGAPLSPAS